MGNMLVEALLFSVGLVYPVHLSLSAIASGSRDDSLQVLCYWMLHALLLTVEELLESVIVMIPLYSELKLFFLLWAVAPSFRGATLLFQTYVQPILERTQRASGSRPVDSTPALEKASRFMHSLQAAKEKMLS